MRSDRPRIEGPGVLCALLLALASAASGEQRVQAPAQELRRFEVVHRPLDEAYRLVSGFLSDSAEVRVVRAEKALEVKDERERIERIAAALALFDVPSRTVRLALRVVKGERREVADPGSDAAKGVPRDVRELVSYNSFETLGTIDLVVREKGVGQGLLGEGDRYRIQVLLGEVDRIRGTIEVKSLALEKRLLGPDGKAVYRPIVRFAEDLSSGKTRVLFATSSTADRRALFLVLSGTIE